VSLVARIASIFRSIAIVIAIAVVFLFGVATTVYLSLRSPEVKVPDVVGKDKFEAEKILAAADLKYRIRSSRPSKSNPDIVMFQLPRAGEVVKSGQTVAVDISRVTKEGETPENVTPDEPVENRNTNSAANSNENKPKKPRPKNTNENANDNTNRSINANRANVNTTGANVNATPRANVNATPPRANVNATPRANVNRTTLPNVNTRPAAANENKRPATPRPTPKP
jgi:beta-lactam-binding protein with PASTA domain